MKFFTTILFFSLLGGLFAQTVNNFQENNVTYEIETFETSISRGFKNLHRRHTPTPDATDSSNPEHSFREYLIRNKEDFGGTGPHSLNIYMRGEPLVGDHCEILIDVEDRVTGQIHIGWIFEISKESPKEGYTKIFELEGVKYEFTITDCPSIAMWGYFWNNGEVVTKRTIIKNHDKIKIETGIPLSGNLINWKMTDVTKEILEKPKIIFVTPGTEEDLDATFSNTRQLSFDRGGSNGGSLGINFSGLEAALQKELDVSEVITVGQTRVSGRSSVLKSDFCDTWLVQKVTKVKYGEVIAPEFKANKPIKFTLVIDSYYLKKSLCEEGVNKITRERYEKEQAKLDSLKPQEIYKIKVLEPGKN
ncbi:hypothetical protein EZY14_007455 [Kordia sp. TARA_039_SRF]|nr:hypothetical protein EZY14_007455 [Kordia sp. TARA_039_SRF]